MTSAPNPVCSIVVPFHRNLSELKLCVTAIRTAIEIYGGPAELIVVADSAMEDCSPIVQPAGGIVVARPQQGGPARARNTGASVARGQLILFVDSDVEIAPDVVQRFVQLFQDPSIDAAFGAYDDEPGDAGFVSQAKNLGHSFVHRRSKREAQTFWGGLGAIRATAFNAVGGFDERFTRPSVEDIDLGYRLRLAGFRVVLDPAIRGRHLKRWTMRSVFRTDLLDRGIPWTQLLHRRGSIPDDLNLSYAYRLCVVIAYIALASIVGALWRPGLLWVTAASLVALMCLDWPYYAFLTKKRGLFFTARWFPIHVLHHLANGLAFAAGSALFAARRCGISLPRSLPTDFWHLTPAASPAATRTTDRLAIGIVVVLALVVGGIGLRNEGYVDLGGDEPRYLMNSVFFFDLMHDARRAMGDPVGYAQHYYSRYPALSIGYHPVVPSLLAVPAYALFGISIAAARSVPLACFAIAAALLFLLTRRIYDSRVARLAALLFVLSPASAWFSRTLTSEMPALAAILFAAFFCERFARTGKRLDLWLFMVSCVGAIWAKQITAVVIPVFLLHIIRGRGIRALIRRDVLMCATVGLALALPVVPITLRFSAHNVAWVTKSAVSARHINYLTLLTGVIAHQLSWPAVVLAGVGAALAALNRDARSLFFVGWIATVACLVIFLTKDIEADRYSLYWMPALAVLAATSIDGWRQDWVRRVLTVAAILIVVVQAVAAARVDLPGATGYEEAASYVVSRSTEPVVVVFSPRVDTGYFVFFVRKYDPARHVAIVRADTLATATLNGVPLEGTLENPGDARRVLDALGARFLVVEYAPSDPAPPSWIQGSVSRSPFVERARIPLRSNHLRLREAELVVFENTGATLPDPNARFTLDLRLPRMRIDLRPGDLVGDHTSE